MGSIEIISSTPDSESLVFHWDAAGNGVLSMGTEAHTLSLGTITSGTNVAALPTVLDSGVAILTAGTVTVTSAKASAGNVILLTYYSIDGTLATVAYKTVVEATSFVIVSSNDADTNQVSWCT